MEEIVGINISVRGHNRTRDGAQLAHLAKVEVQG